MYRYRCGQCRTTSLPVRSRVELYAARDRHRRVFHGGHVPDGEKLLRYRGRRPRGPGSLKPLVVAAILIAVLLLQRIAHH